ncbi:MAG TPA: hypothetical protein GXZ21_12645 [Clostridiales bacterium]|nr:hypothetical protein [Clostridiales bacterium]
MRKIKNNKKKVENVSVSQKRPIIIISIAAVALLIMVILMVIESSEGKLKITNNTDANIEYVQAYFVGAEGRISDGFNFENMEAGKTNVVPSGEYELFGEEANLEVRFKFEGSNEVFVDAGYFNDNFSGNININFSNSDEDNIVNLHVKAKNGVLKSNRVFCDDEFKIDIVEGMEIE